MRKCLSYILTAILILTLTFGFSGYVLATESDEEPSESTVTSVAEPDSSEETSSEETSSQESSKESSSEEEASSGADDTSSEKTDNSDVSSEESSDSQSDESNSESSEKNDSSATDHESSGSSEEESSSEISDNEDDDDDYYYHQGSPSSFVKEYFNDLDKSEPSKSQNEPTLSVSKNISDYSHTGRLMMIISVIVAIIAVALLIFINVSAHKKIVAARKRAARKSRLQARSHAMEEIPPETQNNYYPSDDKFVLQDDFDFGDDFIIGSKDDK